VVRRSYLGELGFEIYPTTDLARHVFAELLRAGAGHGLRPAGFLSQASCRLETGFVHYGHDVTEDDSPLEAGLGSAVAFGKPGGFIGRDALERQRAAPPGRRLVNLRVRAATAQAGPYLLRNEPLWQGDEIVGHVTSGAWGYRVGGSLGMGWLRPEEGFSPAWLKEAALEVEVAGERHAIEAQTAPFYDPGRERLRS
jgi:glycine cleavage system aminomethyltransferase T